MKEKVKFLYDVSFVKGEDGVDSISAKTLEADELAGYEIVAVFLREKKHE